MSKTERIRFGGKETPERFLFELTGGNLALDLVNTVVSRGSTKPRDLLGKYADLVNWSEQVGFLDRAEASSLLGQADRNPRLAARALSRAVDLRETLHSVFGVGPDEAGLRDLQRHVEPALRHRRLVRDNGSVVWQWERDGLDWMLWPIVDAATTLLTSERRARVRVCAADTCRWLFIDNSRRGNRRWCDMSVCGNRAKARRHYAKVAAGTEAPRASRRRAAATRSSRGSRS